MKQTQDLPLSRIYDHRSSDAEKMQMKKVWKVLVERYFQNFIKPNAVVLDLGAGFCGFINAVKAERKIAVDANPQFVEFADENVETFVSDDLTLSMIGDGLLTHVFISNFLEHLADSASILSLLASVRQKLQPGGSVLILQPNFRLLGPAYFDFIDHNVILTEKSLVEALETTGFTIAYQKTRFLPYTSKSNLSKSTLIVELYLKFSLLHYLFGRQSFLVGTI